MRLLWLSDIHLDHARADTRKAFYAAILGQNAETIVISGDIASGHNLFQYLAEMTKEITTPIYFVAGNHDYYHQSIPALRQALRQYKSTAHWLPEAGIVELTPKTALIGHDGWADGRCGSWWKSNVDLSDYHYIVELAKANLHRPTLLKIIQALAAEAAEYVAVQLNRALKKYDAAVFVTHVPPWRKAATHQGKPSDNDWAPHFVSQIMGDTITGIMDKNLDKELLVLTGHTHGIGTNTIRPNVTVYTAGAVYGYPDLQQVVEVD